MRAAPALFRTSRHSLRKRPIMMISGKEVTRCTGACRMGVRCLVVLLFWMFVWVDQSWSQVVTRDAALQALSRAVAFFQHQVGVQSTYVWVYSADLAVRRGEGGAVDSQTGWIQPPGTPAVGAAFLRAFEATGETQYLDAAHAVARALMSVQLQSGGWYYSAVLDKDRRKSWCYVGQGNYSCDAADINGIANRTVLDDNTTQSALGFLIWYDQASRASDPGVRNAINYGMKRLMRLQYQNGAFPVYSDWRNGKADSGPLRKSGLPDGDWSRTWVKPETPPYFVVNDDLLRDVTRVLLYAGRAYECDQCFRSAKAVGEFLLMAQLPAPQRGWAQTYDDKMQPVWGRPFEPPAVASRETAGSIQTLLMLYTALGDDRYLQSAREAMEWLKSVRLADGDWSRFYELGTNKPLFVNSKNEVTYSNLDLLDHYTLKSTFDIPLVIALTEDALAGRPAKSIRYWESPVDYWSRATLEERVTHLISAQDPEGRWIEEGWIKSQTFVDAVFALARIVEDEFDK